MRPERKHTDESGQWLSVTQAARLLETTGYSVLTMALRGDLKHSLVDDKPVISRASVYARLEATAA